MARVEGKIRKQFRQVLLFQLDRRQVDQQKYRGEQKSEQPSPRRYHETSCHEQRSQVQRISNVRIGSAGRQTGRRR